MGVPSGDACYWAAAPPSLEGCAAEVGGSGLEKLLLVFVKLKAFVLGAGLATIALTGAAWAGAPKCNTNAGGSNDGNNKYCIHAKGGKNYYAATNADCKCPNPDFRSERTRKCQYSFPGAVYPNLPGTFYTCE